MLAWRADRRVQHDLPSFQRWDRGRPVAADTAGVRTDECAGIGVHLDVRPGEQHPVRPWTTADADQPTVLGRFQRGQGARAQDRIDAHRRPDGARGVLGGQCQRSLESGREPDRARQPPLHVRQQPAARAAEHRDGRHGVHDLERQAILRRRCERSDVAAGDLNPAGGHRRQSRTLRPIRPGCRSSTRQRTRNTRPGTRASTVRRRQFSSATSTGDRRSC